MGLSTMQTIGQTSLSLWAEGGGAVQVCDVPVCRWDTVLFCSVPYCRAVRETAELEVIRWPLMPLLHELYQTHII
jgi:hypothetical protein